MDAALTQKLKQDLHTVALDMEELLKATASQTGERIEQVRARAEASLRAAHLRLADAGAEVSERARAVAGSVDEQVHRHPYASAGLAAGLCFLIGLLIGRR